MFHYSKCKKIDALVRSLRAEGWGYRRGRKHGVLISPNGSKLSVPSTPSDWRAFENLKSDARRLKPEQ